MTLHIYTSGSARQKNDKWIGSYAFTIYHQDKALYQLSTAVQPATQNESELLSVTHAIHQAHQLYPDKPIRIITGSQYVFGGCKQVTKIKTNQHLWQIFNQLYDSEKIKMDFVPKKERKSKENHVNMLAKMKLKTKFVPSLRKL